MKIMKQKQVAIILSVIMVLTTVFNTTSFTAIAADTALTVAEWEFTGIANPTGTPAVPVTPATPDTNITTPLKAKTGSDINLSTAAITSSVVSGSAIKYSYSGGALKRSTWNNTSVDQGWKIVLSTKGYDTLKLNAKTISSNTGPGNWKVQYSLDDADWTVLTTYSNTATLTALPEINLPDALNNLDQVYIRFLVADTKAVNGTNIGSGGTSGINNIKITGLPVSDPNVVQGVTASQSTGSEIRIGDQISLYTATEGAIIKYSTDGSAPSMVYDPVNPIIITELPITIKAHAEKEGLTSSVVTSFTYTQLKVAAVSATPNGGAILPGKTIELKTSTANAKIEYTTDGTNWKEYTTAISLPSLPATIKAKATLEGAIPSVESSFTFTERENVDYNIFFGQVHSHTTNSDGAGTVEEAFNYASKVPGLDFLAVTDHSNSLEDVAGTATIGNGSSSGKWKYGKEEAAKITAASNGNFIGLYAYEMTWSNGVGHINTFNTPGFENRNTAVYKTAGGLKAYYDAIKTQPQGISQFNHPGNTFGDFNDFALYDPELDNLINMIEVGNGEGVVRGSGYFPSYEYYTRALDKGWHVAPTNNQDNHKGKWGDSNTTRTVILADTLSEDNIYDAMRNRRTYATEDNDLKVYYTLNDEVMGTILNQEPETVDISVDIEDPGNEKIGTVEVIVNGGKSVISKEVNSSKETVNFKLPNDYSYYYIRIQQPDKDIAVTAPVWTGEVEKLGISKTSTTTVLPIKGENVDIATEFYNNEERDMTVKSLEFSIDGNVIHTADLQGNDLTTVPSLGSKKYEFNYISNTAGTFNVNVKLIAEFNGVEKIFTDVLKLNISDPSLVTKVIVDGSHRGDYVNGYYSGNMANFAAVAAKNQVQVSIETNITDELLANANLFVITAPLKRVTTVDGVSYDPQEFSEEFIAMVKRYVDNGGNLIVCGMADYQDNKSGSTYANSLPYQTSTQLNKLLEGIGAKTKINNDQVMDDVTNGGQAYRLKFTNYNMASESPLLDGIFEGQLYSFYSGCSIIPDETSMASGETTWLIKGHETTYSNDTPGTLPSIPVAKGDVYALASEKLSGGGTMLVGGTVYISNFEIQAQEVDNYLDLYSNYNITTNMLNLVAKEQEIKPIADARKGNKGDVFTVEGIVTAGTAVSENKFFDTIYIQDQTAGINIFPVSTDGIKVGQKIRVTGSVDEYQGDLELRVISYKVINTEVAPLQPIKVTTSQASDYGNFGGSLVKVEGTITKVLLENNVVSYALVKDSSGTEIRVFIDGYIGYSNKESAALENFVVEGKKIQAVGLVSYDPDGVRIRVRDRSEIVAVKPGSSSGSSGSSGSSTPVVTIPSTPNVSIEKPSDIKAAIQTQIANKSKLPAGEKPQINIAVKDVTKISMEALSGAKNEDIDLNFIMDKGTVTINGKNLSQMADKGEIDLTIAQIQDKKINSTIKTLSKNKQVKSIELKESLVKVSPAYTFYVGTTYKGKVLYLNILDSNKLTFISKAKVNADGFITLQFNLPATFKVQALGGKTLTTSGNSSIDKGVQYVITKESVTGKNAYVPKAPKLAKTKITLVRKKTSKINISYLADKKTVTYKSSNVKVAKVDKNGKITAVKPGKATITVKVKQNSKTYTLKSTVTVKAETKK
ncbi:chitobiase/beta-hexosaminidase-like protein [Mobilisporobacter senegalensis]|uniref:Chitobiase/beta-hexosaminidase-like protein n=1 Tax=Mobilisporobacter senegalensis TaxID=1329262 RepID=A0A3N1Y030_9FIRM|nr:CehA/McbA family metallohydrolase [Mobilisporobacter senegalensis]ROR31871.1 chitobiase/beta-hexosaminidase-like protein [Mobilisporobacter senegalensis]